MCTFFAETGLPPESDLVALSARGEPVRRWVAEEEESKKTGGRGKNEAAIYKRPLMHISWDIS